MTDLKLGRAVVESEEEFSLAQTEAMQAAFEELKAAYPSLPDEAIATEVFVYGLIAESSEAIVAAASELFGHHA